MEPALRGGLVVGAGGTRKAADGKTPIGFASSCDGAAQAASSSAGRSTTTVRDAEP